MARRSYNERVPLVNELRWDLWDFIHAFVLEHVPDSLVTGEAETNTATINADSYEELKTELAGENVRWVNIYWNSGYESGDTWFHLSYFREWETAVEIHSPEESRALGLAAALRRRIESGAVDTSSTDATESEEAPAPSEPQPTESEEERSLLERVGQFLSHNLVATIIGTLIAGYIIYLLGFS